MKGDPVIKASMEDLEWLADRIIEINADTEPQQDAVPIDQLDLELLIEASETGVGGVADPFGQLQQWISEVISSASQYTVNAILGALQPLVESVRSTVETILSSVNTLSSAISDLTSTLQQYVLTPLIEALEWVSSTFPAITSSVEALLSTITSYLESLPSTIESIISDVSSSLADLVNAVSSAVADVVSYIQQLPDLIAGAVDTIISAIASGISDLVSAIEGVVSTIEKLIQELPGAVEQALAEITNAFAGALQEIISEVQDGVATIVSAISAIPARIEEAMESLATWIARVVDTLTGFLENLPSYAVVAVENVQEWIWENMPDWMKQFMTEAPKALSQVAVTVQGFVNAIMKFPEWFPEWFQEYISKPIAGAISNIVHYVVEYVGTSTQALVDLGRSIWGGLESLVGFVVNASLNTVSGMWGLVEGAVKTLASVFRKTFEELLIAPFKRLAEAGPSILRSVFAGGGELASVFMMYNSILLETMPYIVSVAVLKGATKLIPKTTISLAPLGVGGEAEVDLSSVFREVPATITDIYASMVAGTAIGLSMNMLAPYQWLVRPQAIEAFTPIFMERYGVEAFVEAPSAREIISTIRRFMPLYFGMTDWIKGKYRRREDFNRIYSYFKKVTELYGLPKQYLDIMFLTKDDYKLVFTDRFGVSREMPLGILFEIPTHSEIARMTQKDIFPDIDTMVAVSTIRGMSADVTKMMYLLTFKYPSFEKLWSFAMRAISGALWFKAPEKAYETFRSEAKKLAPSMPDTWLKHPAELNALEPKKARGIFTALNVYLKWLEYSNFPWIMPNTRLQGVDVGAEIKSTLGGWTADSWMLWDIAADIPGKIDARWMVKWGLFETLMRWDVIKGKSFMEALKSLPTSPSPSPIHMDLRPFCRLLQAHGYHPAWIPITAVAEAINALTDERTLLRTGFIRLYKEGLWSISKLEDLLKGFFEATFSIAYFDLEKMSWQEAILKVPVMFLPGERKLLELRAVMDRAYDQFMEFYRSIIRAVRLHVLDSTTASNTIRKFIETINKSYFKNAIKELTGKELSMELDEGYIKAWLEYADIMVDLEAKERTRYYARYILWNIIGAVRTGYITLVDAKKWIGSFVEKIYEHDEVRKMLEFVVEFAYTRMVNEVKVNAVLNMLRSRRITFNEAKKILIEHGIDETIVEDFIYSKVRFYTPSLTTYATLLEIVPEALETSISAIKVFNLPSDEEPYWITYVFRKPIQDELTLLRTRIYSALANGMTVDELVSILKTYAFGYEIKNGQVIVTGGDTVKKLLEVYDKNKLAFQAFGIAPHEWIMYNVIAFFERRIDELKEKLKQYIPTPSTLASIAEVVPEARQRFWDVVKSHHIPGDWIDIWLKYVSYRPITDEVSRFRSIIERLYEYFMIKKGDLESALRSIKVFGYEDEEIKLITYNADLERSYRAYRDLIGTPRELVTMAEYSPSARSIALAEVYKRIDSLPVDRETKELIRTMWEEYIRIRPVYGEVTRYITELINDYARGVITRDDLERELDELRQWGIDEYEKQFYLWLAEKRRKRYAMTGEI